MSECFSVSVPPVPLTIILQEHGPCMYRNPITVIKTYKRIHLGSLCALLQCPTQERSHTTFCLCESHAPASVCQS